MKTKLCNQDNPYIPGRHVQIKIFLQHFSNKFTAGFSTLYHICNILIFSTYHEFSTYQHPNKHHQIIKIRYIFVYNYSDDHGD